MTKVNFYMIPRHRESQEAYRLLNETKGIQLRVLTCPQFVADIYDFPFLDDEKNFTFSGLEEIKEYLSQRQNGAR